MGRIVCGFLRYNIQTNPSIHIVHRTPLMQFPDDVFITLTDDVQMEWLRLVSKANQGLEPEI